jgi:hypothetical protein
MPPLRGSSHVVSRIMVMAVNRAPKGRQNVSLVLEARKAVAL